MKRYLILRRKQNMTTFWHEAVSPVPVALSLKEAQAVTKAFMADINSEEVVAVVILSRCLPGCSESKEEEEAEGEAEVEECRADTRLEVGWVGWVEEDHSNEAHLFLGAVGRMSIFMVQKIGLLMLRSHLPSPRHLPNKHSEWCMSLLFINLVNPHIFFFHPISYLIKYQFISLRISLCLGGKSADKLEPIWKSLGKKMSKMCKIGAVDISLPVNQKLLSRYPKLKLSNKKTSILIFPVNHREEPIKYTGKLDAKVISDYITEQMPNIYTTSITDLDSLYTFISDPVSGPGGIGGADSDQSWGDWFTSFAGDQTATTQAEKKERLSRQPIVVLFTSGASASGKALSAAYADSFRFALVDTKQLLSSKLKELASVLKVTSFPALRVIYTHHIPSLVDKKGETQREEQLLTRVYSYEGELKYDELRKYCKSLEREIKRVTKQQEKVKKGDNKAIWELHQPLRITTETEPFELDIPSPEISRADESNQQNSHDHEL